MRSVCKAFGAIVLLSSVAAGQQYVISTYAGGVPLPTPSPGVGAAIGIASSVATDAMGNVYFSSADLHSIFKLDQNGVLTRVAGNSRPGYSGDGGPATSARLKLDPNIPAGVAVDNAGNLFIVDTNNNRIRRVSPSGIITTVAGSGAADFGDGGPGTSAALRYPTGVAVDGTGNLFIADLGNNRIRKVSPSGIIITVAGAGTKGFTGDGGPATSAELNQPRGVAVDAAGNLFIADAYNFSIRRVSLSGIITTVAGDGTRGFSDDGGPATSARLDYPTRVAVDASGSLFIADGGRIRKVSPSGIITTVAGTGECCFSGDGGPATSAQVFPIDVAVDGAANVFIAGPGSIRKVSPSGMITTVAGNATLSFSASSFSGDGGPAATAQLSRPDGVVSDAAGSLFIADAGNHRVRKVSPSGIITTVAGNGGAGYSGDTGPAVSAQLSGPRAVALDRAGNLFIADGLRIRRVSPSGIIATVAGNGMYGLSSGDGGPATSAQLNNPTSVGVDGAGNLFIVESADPEGSVGGRVRKVSPDGVINTVAGNGSYQFSGDGGPATNAGLQPVAVAVDGAGNLFIADGATESYGGGRIRKVSPSGIITTVAGSGELGSSGDGGPALSAALGASGVAVDGAGNLFITEGGRVRKVSASGTITTIAGNGLAGYSGDGGPAISAVLSGPAGIAVDGTGNVFVADGNNAVRVLRPTNHNVIIGAVVDAASQSAVPLSPGKIVVIYGAGLGAVQLTQPATSQFTASLGGTTVAFNGIPATILYTSDTQVAAVVPYALTGTTAQVTVAYQGETSEVFSLPVAPSAPSIFTSNQTGAGQAAAINAIDGTVNSAINPVKIGGYISLYATGEGQTTVSAGALPRPILPVSITVGGIPATVQYAGGLQGQVAGLMQVNVQIPSGVRPGGYVPIVLQVGDTSTTPGAVWIAVSGN